MNTEPRTVLDFMIGQIELATGGPVHDWQISFKDCYRMVALLKKRDIAGRDDSGDYLYSQENLEWAFASAEVRK